jgi:hypothetical protein
MNPEHMPYLIAGAFALGTLAGVVVTAVAVGRAWSGCASRVQESWEQANHAAAMGRAVAIEDYRRLVATLRAELDQRSGGGDA